MKNYIWIFENEWGNVTYFTNVIAAYTYSKKYLKDFIVGENIDVLMGETDSEDIAEYEAAKEELAQSYKENKAHFGVDGMFVVNREEIYSNGDCT